MPAAIVAPWFGILSFSCLCWLARIHCDRSQSMRSPEFYYAARLVWNKKVFYGQRSLSGKLQKHITKSVAYNYSK